MDIGLDTEQLALRTAARDVLSAECPTDLIRQAEADPHCWRRLWKTMIELGWTGLANPENGHTPMDTVVVLEECGAALAPAPLLSSTGLAGGTLRAVGADGKALLAELGAGTIATLAVQAPGQRLPTAPMLYQSGRVRGYALAVPDLPYAQVLVTLARSHDRTVVAPIRLSEDDRREGDSETAESIDPTRPVGHVRVDAAPVFTAVVDPRAALAPALIYAAAELVGVASVAVARAVAHARGRTQFDRPIGSFQGVKHALANCHVAVERARSLTYAAASRLADADATTEQVWISAALAKAAAGEAAVAAARTNGQVHGALSQSWEHACHFYQRRAWQMAALLGDSRALYGEVGRRFIESQNR